MAQENVWFDYDINKSLSSNTGDSGSGQMGSIMLNFKWNEVQQSKGFSELAKPVWDQKLYPGEMFGMEVPSIRTVAGVAVAATAAVVGAVVAPVTGGSSAVLGAVVASAIGAAATFTNEFVFAMLDLTGEYKSPEEIGKQLAIKAATDAVSVLSAGAGAAVSGISGIAGVAARTGVSVATGVTSTVATNAMRQQRSVPSTDLEMRSSLPSWKIYLMAEQSCVVAAETARRRL